MEPRTRRLPGMYQESARGKRGSVRQGEHFRSPRFLRRHCCLDPRVVTLAGRQLGVSSSAIGKAAARMEERLGVRLFYRSTRSITLTAEGALFRERCRRIFSELQAAALELSQTHEAPRGTLRVSLPLVGMLMMPTLVAFMRAYPEIMLDLDFSDRVVDVIEEGFDAVVRFAEAGDSRGARG